MFQDLMENPSRYSPVLLVGEVAVEFRKLYKGPQMELHSVADVKQLIAQFSRLSGRDYPIVVDDLAYLSQRSVSMMLKLIEESKLPIIILSSFDCVSPMLRSRIRTFIKRCGPVSATFSPVSMALTAIQELPPDHHQQDRMRVVVAVSPRLHYLTSKLSVVRNRDRLLSLLGG